MSPTGPQRGEPGVEGPGARSAGEASAPETPTADDDGGEDGAAEPGAERRAAEPKRWPPDEGRGEGIVRFNVWATLVFAVVSAAAAAVPDPLVWVSVPLDLALFAVGCGAFLWAYAIAIGRSRYETLTMGGVFFLGAPTAPARVTRTLRLLLLAQVVVSVAAAAVRPFTPLAFSVLAPMLGLGLMALWGARHGTFVPRSAGGAGD